MEEMCRVFVKTFVLCWLALIGLIILGNIFG